MAASRFVGLLSVTIIFALATRSYAADPASRMLGLKVLPKEGCEVAVNGVVVNFRSLSFPMVVQNVDGPWLWVGDDRKGWVLRNHVVTLDEAPAYYTRLIKRNPRNAWAYNFRTVAWRHRGEFDRAIADYSEMLRLMPTAVTYTNRGVAWEAKQEYDRAIADHNQAIRLDPANKIAYFNRGDAWSGKKEYSTAIADFNEAIRLDPNYSSPYKGLAWIYATCPDGQFRDGARAVRLATRACELSGWTDAEKLSTLAAAYAEAGDFEQALEYSTEGDGLACRQCRVLKDGRAAARTISRQKAVSRLRRRRLSCRSAAVEVALSQRISASFRRPFFLTITRTSPRSVNG